MVFYDYKYRLGQMSVEKLQAEFDKRLKEFREARSKLIIVCQVKGSFGEAKNFILETLFKKE